MMTTKTTKMNMTIMTRMIMTMRRAVTNKMAVNMATTNKTTLRMIPTTTKKRMRIKWMMPTKRWKKMSSKLELEESESPKR